MTQKSENKKYLSSIGAWALSFGCAVGWGSFVMPGNTFLPIAGPVGTALGLGVGGLVMLVLAYNFHHLVNWYPDSGGAYTYTKLSFGYDHGFLSAWFLILTYIAIIWANATALPLIARTLLGDTFRFGYLYEIAGYKIYVGELMVAIMALLIAAIICLHRKSAERTQIIMALLLITGVVICFIAAMKNRSGGGSPFTPAFAPGRSAFSGTFTIFALVPWAYVGFESITHSSEEAKFPLKKTFAILTAALITSVIAYVLLALLAVTALPEDCASWTDYIGNLGKYEGIASQPTFHAAYRTLGNAGSVILGVAALGAVVTGLIGNYIALSRLMCSMADDGLLPEFLGRKDNETPKNAIILILLVSVALPFFGRTAISWIVDVTTIGATVAYALASASAWKTAKKMKCRRVEISGIIGIAISLMFALEFLVPSFLDVTTLSTESYLILALWSILGFIYFRFYMSRDKERRLGRSIVAWVVLLGLIVFTSSIWMRQTSDAALEKTAASMEQYYADHPDHVHGDEQIQEELRTVLIKAEKRMDRACFIQMGLIILSLGILLEMYTVMQKREKQIEVEKVLAEESSRAKTSFLSNMSHEIRTPMNAIIGLDNIALRDPNLSSRTREHLEKIGASAKHLLGLINDILDMSRIESGRMVLKNEEFSFREFLDQINIIINGQCQDKGLHFECNIIGHVSDYYFGDDMKLKQVLINILGNSVKFTNAPGSVTLTVEQTANFEGFCTMRFTMSDTGIGMDKEYIPKIFEAFSQEDMTTTNKYGGSGLGMAITKNFVEMMNGEIHVDSEKGVGSTFTVTVTLKASSRSARADENINLPADLRAIVVDDDEISCEHTQVVLRAIGIEPDIMVDSEAAVALIKEAADSGQPYQLLITDYKMPGINGLELTKAVREFDNGKTAVIMLTGYNWDIIEDEAKEGGVDGILAKPLFSEILQREINNVLARRSGQPQADDSQKDMEGEGTEGQLNLAGKRVLMAEDVEQNAEILADLLELEEMEAEHAANGQIAVDMFAKSPAGYYDVILMDVRMPVKDGLTATREIRALGRPDAKTIPIIAMTANVFDEDVERSLQAGMNAHLSKPVEPEHLYETMARLMG